MKTQVRDGRKLKRAFIWALALFAAIFLLRWAYELFAAETVYGYPYLNGFVAERAETYTTTSNVASKAYAKEDIAQNIVIDQKFEKTANLSAQTAAFQQDNERIRQSVEEHGAVIQQEAQRGLEGNQTLALVIGVPPEQFDGLVAALRAIGKETSFSTDQVDKTQEYRALLAQRETLQKTQDAYRELKAKGGSLQDQLLLEEKILETERSLQDLGVNLGLYADEYSFCTVNVQMQENQSAGLTLRRIGSAAVSSFLWTLSLYGLLTLVLLLAFAAAFVVVWGTRTVKKIVTSEPEDNPPKDDVQNDKD